MRGLHSDGLVNASRVHVVVLDIQAKSADVTGLPGPRFNKIIKPGVDPPPTRFGPNIDALYPPKPGGAPVAPLRGDHQTADYAPILFRHHVKPFAVICKDGLDPPPQDIVIK